MAGSTQVRASFGGFVGYDYTALRVLARDLGIQTTPGLWRKVQAVEMAQRQIAEKQAKDAEKRARHDKQTHPVRRR